MVVSESFGLVLSVMLDDSSLIVMGMMILPWIGPYLLYMSLFHNEMGKEGNANLVILVVNELSRLLAVGITVCS